MTTCKLDVSGANSFYVRFISFYIFKLIDFLFKQYYTSEDCDYLLCIFKKKREIGLPVLNFDATVRQLHAKEKGLKPDAEDLLEVALPLQQSTEHRILDRFLVSLFVLFTLIALPWCHVHHRCIASE